MHYLYIGCYDKAEVLAALYNAAVKPGEPYNQNPMSVEHARSILSFAPRQSFDEMEGRKLYIDLQSTYLDTYFYDSANGGVGSYAAEKALSKLRKVA